MTPLNLPAGIHRIAADVYHADLLRPDVTLSRSLAAKCLRSAEHAWTHHPRLNPDYTSTTSETFDFGKAAHRALLGVGGDVRVMPPQLLSSHGGIRSAEARALKAEWEAEGATVVKQDVADKCAAMAMRMKDFLAGLGVTIDPALSEMTALAEVDGVWCRSMFDNCPDKPIMLPGIGKRKIHVDLKTTEDASPADRKSVV